MLTGSLFNGRSITMESKNLLIAFVWIFVLVITIGLFWVGESYVAGIGGPFIASVILFIVALIFSVLLLQGMKEKK
jgi:FtsH-binding integral membrane protein